MYCVAQIVLTWPYGALSVGFHIPLTYPIIFCVCAYACVCVHFKYLLTFLAFQDASDLYIFCFSPRISHFPKVLLSVIYFFLFWRMVSKTKIWMLDVFIANGVIASQPSQLTESENICKHTNLCVSMHVYYYFPPNDLYPHSFKDEFMLQSQIPIH